MSTNDLNTLTFLNFCGFKSTKSKEHILHQSNRWSLQILTYLDLKTTELVHVDPVKLINLSKQDIVSTLLGHQSNTEIEATIKHINKLEQIQSSVQTATTYNSLISQYYQLIKPSQYVDVTIPNGLKKICWYSKKLSSLAIPLFGKSGGIRNMILLDIPSKTFSTLNQCPSYFKSNAPGPLNILSNPFDIHRPGDNYIIQFNNTNDNFSNLLEYRDVETFNLKAYTSFETLVTHFEIILRRAFENQIVKVNPTINHHLTFSLQCDDIKETMKIIDTISKKLKLEFDYKNELHDPEVAKDFTLNYGIDSRREGATIFADINVVQGNLRRLYNILKQNYNLNCYLL